MEEKARAIITVKVESVADAKSCHPPPPCRPARQKVRPEHNKIGPCRSCTEGTGSGGK
jgi:hypothetical protein